MVEAISAHQSSLAPTATARSHGPLLATSTFSVGSDPEPTTGTRVRADPSTAQPQTGTPAASQDTSGANDFRQLFGNPLPAAVPFSASNPPLPYGYPDPVSGSVKAAAAADVNAGTFVPVFQNATVSDGTNVWNANHDYFASQQTAQWIANKYGTGQLVTTPFEGSGGPYGASASEYQIVLADGRMVNAGILASYYERNPESQFPGLADTLIRSQLGLG